MSNAPSHAAFLEAKILVGEHFNSKEPFNNPQKIESILDANSAPEWEPDWIETYILYFCIMRKRPARAHALLGQLERMRAARGEQVLFDEFNERLKKFLHPYFVTNHGYTIAFGKVDSDKIMSSLGEIFAPLEKYGYPIFLYAGALLGHVRSGKLIAHDDDVDVGVYIGECADKDVSIHWRGFKAKLVAEGLLDPKDIGKNSPILKFRSKLDFDIDLFPAWTNAGRFSVYPYSSGEIEASSIFPLKSYGQDPVMLPADAEALLEQSYGKTWRVPDPHFRVNWRARRRLFPHLRSVNYSMAVSD